MSLDNVELVMKVEETFDITINDLDAEKILTLGDLYRDLLARVEFGAGAACPSSAMFYQLRRALMKTFGVGRERVRPALSVEELVSRDGRRENWVRLAREIGFRLPDLRRPPAMRAAGTCYLLAVCLPALPVSGLAYLLKPDWAGALLAALVVVNVVMPALWLFVTQPFAVEIAPECLTVRALVGSLVAGNLPGSVPPGGPWNRAAVWEMVVAIVSEQAGVSRDVLTEDTSFVDDLGLD